MEGAGGSHYVTFQYHYSYAFKKGHCSPTKWGVTVWMSFLPPRKGVVCTSGHKAFLRLGLYGDGGESKNLVFQARLIISIRRKGVCHIDVVETAFTWTWLVTGLCMKRVRRGILVTWQSGSRRFTFSHLSVTDGVIHPLLKIKASQITEVKNKA